MDQEYSPIEVASAMKASKQVKMSSIAIPATKNKTVVIEIGAATDSTTDFIWVSMAFDSAKKRLEISIWLVVVSILSKQEHQIQCEKGQNS